MQFHPSFLTDCINHSPTNHIHNENRILCNRIVIEFQRLTRKMNFLFSSSSHRRTTGWVSTKNEEVDLNLKTDDVILIKNLIFPLMKIYWGDKRDKFIDFPGCGARRRRKKVEKSWKSNKFNYENGSHFHLFTKSHLISAKGRQGKLWY